MYAPPPPPPLKDYEDDSNGSTSDAEVEIENEYYKAKGRKEEGPKEALEGFQKVLDLEQMKGEWGFKALKQMLKLLFKLVGGVS